MEFISPFHLNNTYFLKDRVYLFIIRNDLVQSCARADWVDNRAVKLVYNVTAKHITYISPIVAQWKTFEELNVCVSTNVQMCYQGSMHILSKNEYQAAVKKSLLLPAYYHIQIKSNHVYWSSEQ